MGYLTSCKAVSVYLVPSGVSSKRQPAFISFCTPAVLTPHSLHPSRGEEENYHFLVLLSLSRTALLFCMVYWILSNGNIGFFFHIVLIYLLPILIITIRVHTFMSYSQLKIVEDIRRRKKKKEKKETFLFFSYVIKAYPP